MAYCTADYLRWQQLDFVVGIRVVLSNNHTLNGKAFRDICDELSAPMGSTATKGRGCYPKDFKFTGWHPLCRCHAETILKTPEELAEDNNRILRGEEPAVESVNRVDSVPTEFKGWLRDNRERIDRAKSLPYFIRDNKKAVDKILSNNRSAIEIAAERHAARTEKRIEELKLQAWNRQLQMNMPQLTAQERSAIAANWLEIEKELGIKKGRMMTIEEADRQSANPKFGTERAYGINCQTCSPAFMLRMWGFNVTAKGNYSGTLNAMIAKPSMCYAKWKNIDNSEVKPNTTLGFMSDKDYKVMNKQRYVEFFQTECNKQGFYELTINWKGGGGHSTLLYRNSNGGLFYVEPQAYNVTKGIFRDINELAIDGGAKPWRNIGIARIDNKLFNKTFLSIFDK